VTIGCVSLDERLERELADARRRRDDLALTTLGVFKSEVVRATKEPGARGPDDALIVRVAQRELKRRDEAATAYRNAGRISSAEREESEAELLRMYLPPALSDAELEQQLRAIIGELKPEGPQAFGQVMKAATVRLSGRADGGKIAAAVKRLLA
jgi:uncharacterized protein YqeY